MAVITREKRVFGTDGVRGKANHWPMTVEVALALGRAAGEIFRRDNPKPRVVIGKDTRLSCYMFENALISGLCSMGVDTLMVGPFPTPGVGFITRAYRADAGVVISASHNPYCDNGIKFFNSEGFKFPDAWEEEMEAFISKNDFSAALPREDQIGRNRKLGDADGRYIEFLKATFPKRKTLRPLKIVLDCSNGAGYKVAPLVFRELDAEVFVYGDDPNGLNINDHVGSLFPQTIQKGVIDHKADVGIALDGDADRVIMVDENAQIVEGDTLLAIAAKDMHARGELAHNRVVTTQMSNLGFIKAMEQLGISVIQSAVGDRYVIQEMINQGANLGGEQSGHLIFLDHNTTGDGLVSALQVLRIMMETNSRLSDLTSFVRRYPQIVVNVPVHSKPPIETLGSVTKEIDSVKKLLGENGRVFVRYSGTELLCRVMVEGQNQKQVTQLAGRIASQIKEAIGR